ncbi:MAG: response regulator transcription factor [Bacteroidales bacterium]|nr:response regulator transcription factor [Bacteroidales bacterium]
MEWVKDGKYAVEAFKKDPYDLCILDVMLPNVDGFAIARSIKEIEPEIPFIFLTAKTLKQDELYGYQLGADDYIKKPFDSEVLLCKIRAILKRKDENHLSEKQGDEYHIGKYCFNHRFRTLEMNNASVKLSPKEAELLKMLCETKGNILPRDQALKTIWGESSYFTTRSMDVFITKIRKYLSGDPVIKLENIHGSGFRLIDEGE